MKVFELFVIPNEVGGRIFKTTDEVVLQATATVESYPRITQNRG